MTTRPGTELDPSMLVRAQRVLGSRVCPLPWRRSTALVTLDGPEERRRMRRRKETAVPARAAGPALRIRSASKEPEAPAGTSAADFFVDFSAKDTSSRCDPFPVPRCETPSDSASDLGLETNQTRELLPPPPRGSANRNSDPCVRDLAAGRGKMFQIFRSFPTQMDYKGQKLAEQIFQGIILVSAVIGFIYGYITEQFGWTVYIVMAGFALSCLLTLPPWPMYRRNPLKWLPVQESATDDKKPADRKVKRHPKN